LFALPFQAAALVGCALILVSLGATLGEVGTRIDAAAAALRRPTLSPARFARTHAGLAAAAVLAGIFEVGTSAMATVHALHLGFSAPAAVFAAAVIAGGSLVAQLPAGWLADRVGLPTLMRACGLGMAASAAALPLADSAPLVFWVLTALWGAFGGALQTLVYLSVAKSRDPSAVGPAMAVLAIGCTLGSLIGPGLGGIAMDLSPSLGLALALTLSAAVLTVVVGRRRLCD
ncbi:MAG: MFS transporter, partial [Alphaproteobacteria bacterium]|nr:MFS transporter [Alphaproteobacteria bacterium]